jgi:hypothetical protein
MIARKYARNGGLYDRIPTPYAPLFFEAVAGLSRALGVPIDNAFARWIALVVWAGASFGALVLVLRATGDRLLALAAFALAFPQLWGLQGEPMHPSHGIVLLLPVAFVIALAVDGSCSRARAWAFAGAVAGAVLCMKLNVGAFLLFAFSCELLRRMGSAERTGVPARIALLVLCAFPILLMRPRFDEPWVRALATIEAGSLAALALIPWFSTRRRPSGASTFRCALALAAASASVGVVAAGIALATGSTLRGLWSGLVVDTARFPLVYSLSPRLPSLALALAPLALVPVVAVLHREGRVRGRGAGLAIAAMKGAAVVVVLLVAFAPHRLLMLALPWIWLLAVPVGKDDERGEAGRWLLAFLAVAVSMQVYPVAGTQVNFSAFLLPPLALVGLRDAWIGGARLLRRGDLSLWRTPVRARARTVSLAAVLLAAIHPSNRTVLERLEIYRRSVPLGLPGTAGIRLPESDVAEQRWLAANLRANGTSFFGVPGVHSQYIWTGEEAPVPFYPHVWMLGVRADEETRLAEAIASRADLCVVRNERLADTWLQGRPMPESPIVDAIDDRFEVAARCRDYELLLPRGRKAELPLSARPVADASGRRAACRLSLPAIPGVRVKSFEICDPDADQILFDTSTNAAESKLEVADLHGRLLAGPIATDDPTEILVLGPKRLANIDPDRALVRVRDESRAVVARLVFPR